MVLKDYNEDGLVGNGLLTVKYGRQNPIETAKTVSNVITYFKMFGNSCYTGKGVRN